jgi:glycosyltransferase involved in cell wall biosynthesis
VKSWIKKNQEEFDIIHAQGRSGYLLYQLPDIQHKLVQTIHGNTGTEASTDLRNINAKIHAYFAQIWEKKSLQNVRKTIAVSQDLKNSVGKMKSLAPSSIEVIPNGVGINEDPTGTNLTNQRIDRFVFVGRLHPVKGLIPIIEAIKSADRKIFLDIIGDGPQRAELEKLIQDLSLEHQVRLLGAYTNSSVQLLLPHYTGLVLPSIYESQGIVLLEANLKGIPVIASDLPSIRESIVPGQNGLLCDVTKPEEFIQAMIYLQENPRKAKEMGRIGQAWVKENYNWSKIADLTISLYHQLAS